MASSEKLVEICCDWCGKAFKRHVSRLHDHNFCSRTCLARFSSKKYNPDGYRFKDFSKNSARFTKMNQVLNPERMTPETRAKIRTSRLNTGNGESYEKFYGRHTHRAVAEEMLGRQLLPGEVVHHIDGNKRNNNPENLMVFPSQAEHARWHKNAELKSHVGGNGGDAK